MKKEFHKLMLEQVQESLNTFLNIANKPIPKNGWIKTIREALGISSTILAHRLNCTRTNVTKMEQREKKGTISLESLERVAQAMNCKLAYCFIPLQNLDIQLEKQARLLAKKRVMTINHSMKLEEQGLTAQQLKKQENDLVEELLQGNLKDLWTDETL